jgi:hypothetical protein
MPVIQVRTALGANSTATPLAGTQYEFLGFDAFVEFAMQADATGVLATVQSGTDVLQEESPVQLGTINVQPKYPDDFFLNDVAAAGERLKVALRDTSGVARTVMTVVRITPV